jgi:hypothetical protein
MKITHKKKLRFARSKMMIDEVRNHVGPFHSRYWLIQKALKQSKVQAIMDAAVKRREEREAQKRHETI